jgi:hypothetical protein
MDLMEFEINAVQYNTIQNTSSSIVGRVIVAVIA